MSKYIFISGGVVSGLGKGITSASIGLILRSNKLTVDAVKFDPYLNVDPGTMSPYEHGEVYVLEDGSETDLDLGHYERFLNTNLTGISSVTAGKIYGKILNQEREGQFLGKNVQLIPHITNYIKECFSREFKSDVRLIEIGGSTGDYEGDIFLESLRQFKREHSHDVFHIHLGYVPFLDCSGEYKTKPLQVSLRELSRAGLQPDMIVARYSKKIINGEPQELSDENLRKIALFSSLPAENVLALPDLESIYQVPVYLQNLGVQKILNKFLNVETTSQNQKAKLPDFFTQIEKIDQFKTIKIAVVAKYTKLVDSYLSIFESLKIAGIHNQTRVEVILIDAEKLEEKDETEWNKLQEAKGIIVPGGFGVRGMEGKIEAVKYARKNKIPYLGICLGLQMAVLEFARNVCGLDAVSAEMYEDRSDLADKDVLIDLMPEQFKTIQKGGTMRLGAYKCNLIKNTLAYELFQTEIIEERHRHRLEVQNKYVPELEKNGLIISGKYYKSVPISYLDGTAHEVSKDVLDYLVEIVELPKEIHPYFIATQSHPEFLSRPGKPHPLFDGLVRECLGLGN